MTDAAPGGLPGSSQTAAPKCLLCCLLPRGATCRIGRGLVCTRPPQDPAGRLEPHKCVWPQPRDPSADLGLLGVPGLLAATVFSPALTRRRQSALASPMRTLHPRVRPPPVACHLLSPPQTQPHGVKSLNTQTLGTPLSLGVRSKSQQTENV